MEARKIEIAEKIPASRKLQRADAADLLKKVQSMTVSKGKKVAEFSGGGKPSKDALDAMLGSTGNLRAPAIVVGKTLLIGFNEEVYSSLFG